MLETLKKRFEENVKRHPDMTWNDVLPYLNDENLRSVELMEKSGGEPDLVVMEDGWYYCDCSMEAPDKRRSVCYDEKARLSRKKNAPENSAEKQAAEMGIRMLTCQQYNQLQQYGEFDLKTSCWIDTPQDIRALGGALFCERRYGKVFVYHNGADSYYGVRGWRGCLKIR